MHSVPALDRSTQRRRSMDSTEASPRPPVPAGAAHPGTPIVSPQQIKTTSLGTATTRGSSCPAKHATIVIPRTVRERRTAGEGVMRARTTVCVLRGLRCAGTRAVVVGGIRSLTHNGAAYGCVSLSFIEQGQLLRT